MCPRTAPSRLAQQALATLRDHDKFLLTTHERPDGDAVGSLAAMQHVLTALGKDAVAFLTADEFPLPYEYRFIDLDGLVTEPPEDLSERVMVFLDCGNIDRTPAAALQRDGRCILNIDHHHDNTRFGTLNHVDPQRVVHGRDGVGPDEGPRRGGDAGDRRGALRRRGDRHRPLHVREHRLARPRDGGRADRRRDRRARDLPAAVRGHPAGQARAAGARADRTCSASTAGCSR